MGVSKEFAAGLAVVLLLAGVAIVPALGGILGGAVMAAGILSTLTAIVGFGMVKSTGMPRTIAAFGVALAGIAGIFYGLVNVPAIAGMHIVPEVVPVVAIAALSVLLIYADDAKKVLKL